MKKPLQFALFLTFLFLPTLVLGQSTEQKKLELFYWSKGCEICDELTINGVSYYIFDTPEFGLMVSGSANKKIIAADVYLINKKGSGRRIEFNPDDARLAVYVKPSDKVPLEFKPYSPEQAADKLDGSTSANLKNFFTIWAAGMANQTITTNSTTDGNVIVTSPQGTATGTYNSGTTSTTTVPNAQAQKAANEQAANRNAEVKAKHELALNQSLRANTILEGRDILGRIHFPFKKGAYFYIAIKVGDKVYVTAYKLPAK